MRIETKTVISKIKFSPEEQDFLKQLYQTIEIMCKQHEDCELCPFFDCTEGNYCADIRLALKNMSETDEIG